MRRLITAVALLAVSVAACGGEGEATTTTAAVTTGAETSTTAAVTGTTEDPVAYRLTLATLLAGNWVGEWRNITFGSSGDIAADVRLDEAARTATITLDLGGAVFDGEDPAPIVFTVDLATSPPYAASTELLGSITFSMTDTGAFTLEAADVPASGVATFWATGTSGSERVGVEYGVGFEDGSEAEGAATLRRPAD